MKRGRLRARSAKMARTYVERRRLVAEVLNTRWRCQIGTDRCTGYSTQVHEPLTRARGGSILDPNNCVAVCATCHRWIHAHPAEATRLGWLESATP